MPLMNQQQFIYMWRTLYDMFSEEQSQPEIFHSIAHVGEYTVRPGILRSLAPRGCGYEGR